MTVMYKSVGRGGKVVARQFSYQVIGVFDVEDVLPYIAKDATEQHTVINYVIDDVTWSIRMGSDRMRCLQRDPVVFAVVWRASSSSWSYPHETTVHTSIYTEWTPTATL